LFLISSTLATQMNIVLFLAILSHLWTVGVILQKQKREATIKIRANPHNRWFIFVPSFAVCIPARSCVLESVPTCCKIFPVWLPAAAAAIGCLVSYITPL
ncbi:MAG: hypothetical protein ACYS9H_07180, partial [Planctomycetota bacterium]